MRGATVTGRIVQSDGSAPNATQVGGVAAANFALGEYVVGSVNVDPVASIYIAAVLATIAAILLRAIINTVSFSGD